MISEYMRAGQTGFRMIRRLGAALAIGAAGLWLLGAVGASPIAPADQAMAAEDEAAAVQFRELFDGIGKPSPRAYEMTGQRVQLTGFLADSPTEDSPFVVFVGSPTERCPYCTSIDEREHLPYMLVYTDDDAPRTRYTDRVTVVGTLQADHGYDQTFGIHNDLRLLDAEVAYAARTLNPVLARRRAEAAARAAAEAAAE